MSWSAVTLTRQKTGRDRRRPYVCRWYGDIGHDGKRRRYGKSFATKAAAKAFQAEKQAELNKGGRRDKESGVTLKALIGDFMKTKKSLRPASYRLYEYTTERLFEYFGPGRTIDSIGAKDCALFVAAQGVRRGKKTTLSNWTVAQILTNCRAIFGAAVRWEQITHNPFKAVKKPKLSMQRWHALKVDEYLRLLEQAPDARWRAFYALGYTSGCRFGELFSLTWADIDFERGMVTVDNRPGSPTMPAFHVKDDERREIPLPEDTIRILLDWHEQQPEGTPYILLTPERYQQVLKRWRKLGMDDRRWENRFMVNNVLRSLKVHLRHTGVLLDGKFTTHTLRKSFAQNMANSGMPIRTLQKLLGHSDEKTTLAYYTRVDDTSKAIARDAMDSMIENAKRNLLDADSTRNPIPESTCRKKGNGADEVNLCEKEVYGQEK